MTKEYTLSLGRNHKLRRKPYSESEEYDTDTSGDTRNEILSRTTESSNQHLQEMRNNLNRYGALRYRQQFDLWTISHTYDITTTDPLPPPSLPILSSQQPDSAWMNPTIAGPQRGSGFKSSPKNL